MLSWMLQRSANLTPSRMFSKAVTPGVMKCLNSLWDRGLSSIQFLQYLREKPHWKPVSNTLLQSQQELAATGPATTAGVAWADVF